MRREEKDTRPGTRSRKGAGYPPLARLAGRDLGSDLIAEARLAHPQEALGALWK